MLSSLLLCAVLSQTAQTAPKPYTFVTQVEGISEYRLPNGLRLVLVPDESTPKVTVNLTVMVGSRHEGYGEKGMAHLLEHMLFKGTPSNKDPKAVLNAHGADFNGTTREDRTNYFETVTATDANTEWAIKFEADRMVNSFVARKDLDTEMTVVRNEFEGSENNPNFVLYSRVRAEAFLWHNYGRAVIGTRADIERVPIENLQAFYKRYYQPDNAMLVVAGKFDTNKVFGWVSQSFGKIAKPTRALPSTFTEEPTQDGERHLSVRRVGGTPLYMAAWRIAAASDPDYPALMVLQGVLGDEPQGRAHQVLVDGKKASRARCDLDELREPGLLICTAALKPGESMPAARDALLQTIEQFAAKPFTQAEIDRSRTGWLSQMENTLNASQEAALNLSEWAGIGDWRMLFVQRDRLKKVTVDDVTRVAAKYFKAQNRSSGEYVPTEKPDRAEVPLAANVEPLVKDYKGGEAMAKGEAFDPSPKNIDTRTKRSTLANGAKLALLSKKTRGQTVNLSIHLHFGALDSLKGQREVSRLTATMLERGTKKLNYKDFRSKLETLKAQLATTPTAQTVSIDLEVKRPELNDTLALVAEMLKEPAFDAAEFEVLKKSTLTGLEQNKAEPRVVGPIELARALNTFPKEHPRYVATVPEQLADVNAVTLEQVRGFYGRFFGAQNTEIAAVGDFDTAELEAKLGALFGTWSAKEKFAQIPDGFVATHPGNQQIMTPDKAQAWIGAGTTLALKDTDTDYPSLMLANTVLGGSPAARLFDSLREKQGLSYGAYSALRVPAAARGDRTQFQAFAIYAPQNLSKVETALKGEIDKLLGAGLNPAELDVHRKAMLDERAQARGTDGQLATLLASLSELDRKMEWEQQLEDKLKSVSAADVNAALKKNLDASKLFIVKAGDFKQTAAPK